VRDQHGLAQAGFDAAGRMADMQHERASPTECHRPGRRDAEIVRDLLRVSTAVAKPSMSDSFSPHRQSRFSAASACSWICDTFGMTPSSVGLGGADDGDLIPAHVA